jgi:arylsulfate sulfotransferase
LTWQFHQHAVELTPLGLGMYDNGNHRAAAFEPLGQEYGRAVIFDVDEANMSVSQVWSYGAAAGPDHFFSPIMGDADWQPTTGNVLITNGEIDTGPYIIGQVMEVTPEGERVFQLDVGGDTTVTTRYTSYRAERIVDLRQLTFTADGQPVGLGGSELR